MPDERTPDEIVPDEIVPDDKDWTWVLERRCPECNLDVGAVDARIVGTLIRANAEQWVELLAGPVAELRVRPTPQRWSTLEYAAHVRDVYRLFLHRLQLMLDTDDPLFANWDQDDTAVAERYREQDPTVVAVDLAAAAHELASAFDALEAGQWSRPGRRSDGAAFTVESFARYLIHDPIHHLWDVAGTLAV